ncbi:sigma-70 family RNA polymerase sigma factor [Saccharothrix sp.]|uniref:RNA polymerase sigma factor n=1 Tax=Saccharothrix sp. TaxID=1873460 RepID=UPI002810E45B|nr:sigma-70 family RNA polymerase sigma factor [Saccharothrix sp.]
MRAVRSGDRDAFGELYRMHYTSAYNLAYRLLGGAQGADDVVAEAFTKVLHRILSGGGPTNAFRSYLLTTVRTTFYKQLAEDRLVDRQAQASEMALEVAPGDPVIEKLDADLALRALDALTERWRTVLVQLEIEKRPIAEVAAALDIQPNAVSALAYRAREALRVAYVQMHVKVGVDERCRGSAENLAAWVCGRLGRAARRRVQEHVSTCCRCAEAAREATDLVAQLRRGVPLTAGPSTAPDPRGGGPGVSSRAVAVDLVAPA